MEWLKSHKYTAAGIGVALVIVYFYLTSSGGSSASSASGNDIYAAQAQAAAIDSQNQTALQAASIAASTDLQKTALATDAAKYVTNAQQSVALAQIAAGQEVTDTANTLSANVAIKQIQGQTDVAQIQGSTQVLTTQAITSALVQQSAQQAAVAEAAISNQCHGFGCLF